MERLIIDTDPGVDDAHAIMMAAAHPGAKIEAITAVGGNVGLEHTVRNALTIVEAIGQDIPVYAGCDGPLMSAGEDAAHVHGSDGLGDAGLRPQSRTAEKEHAAVALVRMVNESPGELTLVAIGPLTNIAVALKLDPMLPYKIKRFVDMGGAVSSHGNTPNVSAEFNIYADPEAAHIVFAAWHEANRVIELIDWEATARHGIPLAMMNKWMALDTPKARFFQKLSAATMAYVLKLSGGDFSFGEDLPDSGAANNPHKEDNPLHEQRKALYDADPLAMAVALEPSCVVRAAKRYVTVEVNGRYTRGQTTVDWLNRSGQPANVSIIMEVNHQRFLDLIEQSLY
ncbi:MAG: nucleoside hydrolase [Ardenticatenaceae bacterium]|nr:nucleoside hydrolase [Ardenticatenaceae bacterium]